MYKAHLNEKGVPLAFFNTEFNTDIPEGAVDLTDEEWIILAEGYGSRALVDGVIVDVEPVPMMPEQQLSILPPVSRVQMLAALVDFEVITEAEAVGWLGGDLPAVVQAAINGLPEGAQLVATLRAKAQTPVDPSDPLVVALAASKDMGPEALILLFQHAAEL